MANDLDRATLGNWFGRAFRGPLPRHRRDGPPQLHLKPIVDHMRWHLKGAERLFMDGPQEPWPQWGHASSKDRVPVLDPGRGQTRTGFFWAIVSDGEPSGRHGFETDGERPWRIGAAHRCSGIPPNRWQSCPHSNMRPDAAPSMR